MYKYRCHEKFVKLTVIFTMLVRRVGSCSTSYFVLLPVYCSFEGANILFLFGPKLSFYTTLSSLCNLYIFTNLSKIYRVNNTGSK
jgi:hypothetical protein